MCIACELRKVFENDAVPSDVKEQLTLEVIVQMVQLSEKVFQLTGNMLELGTLGEGAPLVAAVDALCAFTEESKLNVSILETNKLPEVNAPSTSTVQ